jgi:hypothetical protein
MSSDTTSPTHEKWLIDAPRTLDLGVVRRLKVSLVAGQVDVVGHDEPTARVEVHSVSGKALRITLDGDRLEIDHPQLRWDNWIDTMRSFVGRARADVSIMVPHDVALELGVVSAQALVSGLIGGAGLNTVSGEIVVDGSRGDLQLNSVSGEIVVRGHEGVVRAHTVSGDITASGELHRYASDGVSGEVFLDVTGTPDEIAVNTVSGSITARLDAGVAASYAIGTVGGRIQVDDTEVAGIKGRYVASVGDLSGRWLDFRANTVGGSVSVLRAVRATPAPAAATTAEPTEPAEGGLA